MKNKILLIPLALLLVMSLVAAGCPAPAPPVPPEVAELEAELAEARAKIAKLEAPPPEAEYLMRLGAVVSPMGKAGVSLTKAGELVEMLTDGRVKVEVYHGGKLGSSTTMVKMISTGTLESMLAPPSYAAGYMPWISMDELPLIFTDDTDGLAFNKQVFLPAFNEEAAQYNMMGLPGVVLAAGFRELLLREPYTQLADLEGRKIRLMTAGAAVEYFKELGAKPLVMAWGEVATAAEAGVIDGLLFGFEATYRLKFHEITPYIVTSRSPRGLFGNHVSFILVDLDWWNTLPADIQGQVIEGFELGFALANEWILHGEKEVIRQLRAEGTEIITLTAEETAQFLPAAEKTWEWCRKEYGDKVDLWLNWRG